MWLACLRLLSLWLGLKSTLSEHKLVQLKNFITSDIQNTCNQSVYTISTVLLNNTG